MKKLALMIGEAHAIGIMLIILLTGFGYVELMTLNGLVLSIWSQLIRIKKVDFISSCELPLMGMVY
tara:strand:+ start:4839 stop:5036 length:198 start_codon:yes stop_codon:yes gene_type:complete